LEKRVREIENLSKEKGTKKISFIPLFPYILIPY
jgi:hypothetical protein